MSKIIYYFSGTGNSLKVASDLALQLEGVELIQIHQERFTEPLSTASNLIGFVFPTLFSGIPKLVRTLIQKLEVSASNPYVFALATHGDRNGAGIVFEQISSLLKDKNLSLSASFHVQMPHNMPEKDHSTTAEERMRLFIDAKTHLSLITEKIKNRESNSYSGQKIKLFFDRMTNKFIINSTERKPFDKGFYADDHCSSCLLCSKVCPAGNIEMVNGKPQWQLKNCQFCFACLQWCPSEAIQYDKQTIGISRYRHPDIKATDLIQNEEKKD